jgi:ankyrin repeat protein
LKSNVKTILEKSSHLVNSLDTSGFSLVHWAAKKGDIETLSILHEYGAILNQPTSFDAKMLPIHWAASDGKIASIRFLLERRQDINAQDSNGCTPVVIAAQHNQINCVIFLLKNGCDLQLRDTNGDTCIHWAAYKGHSELVGLLSYLAPEIVDVSDYYGQSPLHLSALKGHEEVVEYLITKCHSSVTQKDRNGLTPLELAIKKGQVKVEWALRRFVTNNIFQLVAEIDFKRLKDPKILSYLIFGYNEKEISNWPWRIVFYSNLIGSYTSMCFAMNEYLSDLYLLHLLSTMSQCIFWALFYTILVKSPAHVVDEINAQYNYDKVLDNISQMISDEDMPSVCHTCHICKPLRSKHCKILGRCIHKFDHFCPFVGNTVCRDNYKYFVALLASNMFCTILWQIALVYLWRRNSISWMLFFYMFYVWMWFIALGGLFQFHCQLLSRNLTTNEQINVHKYTYLRNASHQYDNPFDKGNVTDNFMDGLFPSTKSYYNRKEINGRIQQKKEKESESVALLA